MRLFTSQPYLARHRFAPSHHTIRGMTLTYVLAATAVLGAVALTGFEILPTLFLTETALRIEPESRTVIVGDTFTESIVVDAKIPVNVFAGELSFNEKVLNVKSIDYNTSIADLWAKKPWYAKGAGTLTFGGGTTATGGFIGSGSLLTITFIAVGSGNGALSLTNAHILKYDGLGSDATVQTPIDSIFTVQETSKKIKDTARVAVVRTLPSADLNGDGKVSIADASIFILHLLSKDPRFDFNLDGEVNTDDLEILLRTK